MFVTHFPRLGLRFLVWTAGKFKKLTRGIRVFVSCLVAEILGTKRKDKETSDSELKGNGCIAIQLVDCFFINCNFTKLCPLKLQAMNSPSTHFAPSSRLGIYEPIHQIGMWADFEGNGYLNTSESVIVEMDRKLDNESVNTSHGTRRAPYKYDQEASKPIDKVLRRLAQNREAARKSRLRKKAYVQQLENCKLKLIQLEQELEQARQQVVYVCGGLDANHLGYAGAVNSGIAAFEMEYRNWVEEQNRQITELRTALHSHIVTDREISILVHGGMSHYFDLFRMKSTAAKADVFYLMYGMWKTSTERFLLWIGGFRPSELLQVLMPHLQSLTDHQVFEVCSLKQSCQQAEDALSQGMDKLRQTLAETVVAGHLGEGCYIPQMATAMEKLEALESFVKEADHLRQETLRQMSCILTPRQTAQGLLVLGEYCQRLRALSSIWATRSCDPA